MSKRPFRAPIDYRYQEQINKSWDPELKRGDLFWIFNEKTGKVWGPYKFSHYTYLGAVGWTEVPRWYGVKVRYSKGEIVCASEQVALERQLFHKAIEFGRVNFRAEELKAEVGELSKKLKEIRGGTTDQTGELRPGG